MQIYIIKVLMPNAIVNFLVCLANLSKIGVLLCSVDYILSHPKSEIGQRSEISHQATHLIFISFLFDFYKYNCDTCFAD